MFCIACMIFAYDVAVTFALALLLIARNNSMQTHIRTCVLLTRFVLCFEYGLYMWFSMYEFVAHDFAVKFA